MGKVIKVVGWGLGVLLLLVLAAAVILPQVVDPNDYKDEIIAKVKEQTGRDLIIDGRIALSVFPWLGVETGAITLGNAQGFDGKAFAAVKSATVRVKLMPLLSRKLEVDTVGLKGLELNLVRRKDGISNWDDLAGAGQSGVPVERTSQSGGGEQGGESAGLAGISIGGIEISDAGIDWDDRSTGQHIVIEQFQLSSGPVMSGKPVDLQLGLLLRSEEPAVNTTLGVSGVLLLDEADGVIEMRDLRISATSKGEMLPGGALNAILEAAVHATLDGSKVDITGLKLNAGELNLSGQLHGQDLQRQPVFSGHLELADLNLRQWMVDQAMTPPSMTDPETLRRIGASLDLSVAAGATRLENLLVRLDESRLTGNVTLRGSAVGFDLTLDTLDLDRYLPASDSKGEAEKRSQSGKRNEQGNATDEEGLLPVETLRQLKLNGTLNVGRLIINRLLAEQLKLTLKAGNGELELDQQVGMFYQGDFKGKSRIDVRGKSPITRVIGDANNIQVGPLLNDLAGQDKLLGKGRFSFDLTTRGNSVDAFRRSLDGKLDFRFENGAVKGFNVARSIREAKARLAGKPLPSGKEPLQTDFSELSGSGVVRKGTLNNQDLLAKSPFLRVNGAGDINLVTESLDYTVEGVIVNTAKGQGGEGLDDLQGVKIPVHLSGSLAAPRYSINWEKVLLESQKGKVREKIQEKIEEKLKGGKLPGQLQDALKGLFN
ncbi:MAG: AsmA family protein [Chromatiaceae bacterium]|nr:AsmA family protein [Chromatiaceae bacterium]